MVGFCFFDLESAINAVKAEYKDLQTIPVHVEIPELVNDELGDFEVVEDVRNERTKSGRSGYGDIRRKD